MRLKKKDFESKIGHKVIKPILKMFGYYPPSSKDDIELEYYMREQLQKMFDGCKDGITKSMDKRRFVD